MTDLAVYAPGQVATAASPVGNPRALVDWAHAAKAAHDLADALCRTQFCPDSFRSKPGEATAAILAGSEVGLSPMAALNAFDVIQGRPAPKAITLRAVVQSHGHEVWPVEQSPDRVVYRGRRRGSPEVMDSVWTMKRARDLDLANKPNWRKQPQAMLVARATSEICRMVAADAILGIPYSAEEIEDTAPEPTTRMSRLEPSPEQPRRTARRSVTPPPATAEPDLDEPPAPPTETGEAITDAQLRKLHASLGDAGIKERDEALAFLSGAVGRDLTSSKELTKAEASDVIDSLGQGAGTDWPPVAEVPQ